MTENRLAPPLPLGRMTHESVGTYALAAAGGLHLRRYMKNSIKRKITSRMIESAYWEWSDEIEKWHKKNKQNLEKAVQHIIDLIKKRGMPSKRRKRYNLEVTFDEMKGLKR